VFDRAGDGTLTQKPGPAGCISDSGAGRCHDGRALDRATSVAVSPDGQNAYIASRVSDAVAVFDREPSPPATPDTTTRVMSGLDPSLDLSPTLRR
jgi:DNA-binding beta-propeller fold protein YncE